MKGNVLGEREGTFSSTDVELRSDPKAAIPETILLSGFVAVFASGFVAMIARTATYHLGAPDLAVPLGVGTGVAAFVGMVVLSYLDEKSTRYTVSDTGIEKRSGIVSESVETVSYHDISDVHYDQTIFASLFDVGSVHVNKVSEDGTEMVVTRVEDARALYEEIQTRIDD